MTILDLDKKGGNGLAQELGDAALYIECDVTNRMAVRGALDQVMTKFSKIDVLINNAGIYPHSSFYNISDENWRKVFQIDLDAVFLCTQEAAQRMRQRKRGKIINVATNVIWMLVPHMSHYISAKSGVVGFSRAIANELGQDGITVNTIAPGAIMGLFEEHSAEDVQRMRQIVSFQALKRPLLPEDLTGPMVFLCSEDSDFMTGQVLCIDGGLAVP